MTSQHTTSSQHPPRIVRRHASGYLIVLMLSFWLCDVGGGTPTAFAQNIQFTPSALSLTVAQGGTATGTLSLKKSDTAQHSYFISANQSWLWLNPPYGSTQTITNETDILTVTVNTAAMGLSAGTYSGTIYIGQSGPGVSTTWRIPVTATVTAAGSTPPPPPPPATTPPPAATPPPPPAATPPPPPAATPPPPAPTGSLQPMLQAFPAALSLSAAKGNTATGVFNLQKSSAQQSTYSISAGQGWTTLNPPYGSTQTITTEVDPITVSVNTASMNVGSYSGVVYIVESGPNGSQTLRIPVSLSVLAAGSTPPPPPPATTPPPAATPPPPPAATPPPPPAATPPPPAPTGSLTPLMQAFPSALSLTAAKGNTATGIFNLQKSSAQQSTYSISAGQGWTTLNPPYGSTQTITTEVDPITVSVNTASMNVGSYSGVVYIVESGPNGSQTLRIPVSLTVLAAGATAPPPPPPPAPIGGATSPPPPPAGTATGTVTVTWSANTEADLKGYRVYVGTASGVRSQSFDVGKVTSTRLTLPLGSTYWFSVTAYDNSGNESSPSGEISRSLF